MSSIQDQFGSVLSSYFFQTSVLSRAERSLKGDGISEQDQELLKIFVRRQDTDETVQREARILLDEDYSLRNRQIQEQRLYADQTIAPFLESTTSIDRVANSSCDTLRRQALYTESLDHLDELERKLHELCTHSRPSQTQIDSARKTIDQQRKHLSEQNFLTQPSANSSASTLSASSSSLPSTRLSTTTELPSPFERPPSRKPNPSTPHYAEGTASSYQRMKATYHSLRSFSRR